MATRPPPASRGAIAAPGTVDFHWEAVLNGLIHFVRARREQLAGAAGDSVRLVYRSELIRESSGLTLEQYIADRAPLFYRNLADVMADLREGLFLTAFRATLAKIPSSESFRESHCGEIVAGIFAEEVLGLRRLYSKLAMLTAENANAYKTDLVLYDPTTEPIRIVLGEVKCSVKSADSGLPAGHDSSCFASLFKSITGYTDRDRNFDLTAARDNLGNLPEADRERVRSALLPYSGSERSLAAFAVIDAATYQESEARVLRARECEKSFDVDLICVEEFREVGHSAYAVLEALAGR